MTDESMNELEVMSRGSSVRVRGGGATDGHRPP